MYIQHTMPVFRLSLTTLIILLTAASCQPVEMQLSRLAQSAPETTWSGGFLVSSDQQSMEAFRGTSMHSTDDPHPMASLTKLFVKVTVLRLVDQGLLDLDEPVTNWLDPDLAPVDADKMTLRALLDMTAGLPREWDDSPEPTGVELDREGRVLPFLTIRPRARPIVDPSEASVRYSNVSYWIIGAVVESATGEPFERVASDMTFEPLDMESTGFRGNQDDLTRGRYTSGGAYSTLSDLKKFCTGIGEPGFLSRDVMLELAADDGSIDDAVLDASGLLPGVANRFLCQPVAGRFVALLNTTDDLDLRAMNQMVVTAFQLVGGPVRAEKARKFLSIPIHGYPETAMGHAAEAFLGAVATGNASMIDSTFRRLAMPGEFTESELADLGPSMATLPERIQDFEIAGWRSDAPHSIEVVILGSGGEEAFFRLSSTPADSTRVRELFIRFDGVPD